jgi:uncharacterized Zn-finger protein
LRGVLVLPRRGRVSRLWRGYVLLSRQRGTYRSLPRVSRKGACVSREAESEVREKWLDDDMRGWNTEDKCPWCGKGIACIWEHTRLNSDEAEFDCPHCEQQIHLTVWTQFILQRPEGS